MSTMKEAINDLYDETTFMLASCSKKQIITILQLRMAQWHIKQILGTMDKIEHIRAQHTKNKQRG